MILKPFSKSEEIIEETPTEVTPEVEVIPAPIVTETTVVAESASGQQVSTQLPPVTEGVLSVLASVGLGVEEFDEDKNLNHAQNIFRKRGVGMEVLADKLCELLDNQKPEIQMKALEVGLKVHKVYSEEDKGPTKGQVTIVINNNGNENRNLVNLIMPQV